MEVVKDPGNDRDRVLVQMVNQYQGLLLRMCYISLRDMEMAKDATQDMELGLSISGNYRVFIDAYTGEVTATYHFTRLDYTNPDDIAMAN